MVEYLLDHGADIEEKSDKLCSCCDELLRCPHMLPDPPEFYERHPDDDDSIIGDGSCYVDPRDFVSEWKPLRYAICNEHDSTAQLLIERGANANIVGAYRVSALHIATRWELDDTIDSLLDINCVDINAQNSHYHGGVTAVHMAYVAGRYDLVDKYLDRGADINLAFSDQSGPWTIFVMACAAGDYDCALQYLKRGADPHFVLEGEDGDPWTVMRLIYWSDRDAYCYPMMHADERIELEQEIIARGKGSPADT